MPTDGRLAKQHGKRACWDQAGADGSLGAGLAGLVGEGALVSSIDPECDAFPIPVTVEEPAVLLFDHVGQRRELVFRSREGLLTSQECSNVIKICDDHAAKIGGWGTVRYAYYPLWCTRATNLAARSLCDGGESSDFACAWCCCTRGTCGRP